MVCSTLPIVFALLLQTVHVRRLILRDTGAFHSIAPVRDVVGNVLVTDVLRGLAQVWPTQGLLLTLQSENVGKAGNSVLKVELVGLVLLWANTILAARTRAAACSV